MEFHEIIDVDEGERTADVQSGGCTFASLMISSVTLENLARVGFKAPSPIQQRAIPTGLTGLDMLVQAKSGTGKTLVFSVLAVENLNLSLTFPQKIIIAPTREIALQISDTVKRIAPERTRIAVLTGGNPVSQDLATLQRGVHIVIGTSGRLCQLAQQDALRTSSINLFVLDEADKLMNDTFTKDINFLFSCMPADKQVAVFSATYPRQLDETLSKFMRKPSLVRLNAEDVQLVGLKQYATLAYQPVDVSLIKILSSVQFTQAIVFCNHVNDCEPTAIRLREEGIEAACISSLMAQSDREKVFRMLKEFKLKVLVSSDLIARGIDSQHVNMVVNIEPAVDVSTYFHRIGRAGRYGGYGAAITILRDSGAVSKFCSLVRDGGVRAKMLDIRCAETPIPVDLTSNLRFYEASTPFVAASEKKPKGKKVLRQFPDMNERVSAGSDPSNVPNWIPPKQPYVPPKSSNGRWTYSRLEMMGIRQYATRPNNDLEQHILNLELGMNTDFKNDLAELANVMRKERAIANEPEASTIGKTDVSHQPESLPNKENEEPKKFKFVPSRLKNKKKFYLRGEMIKMRDSFTNEQWRAYAETRAWDMTDEPFVTFYPRPATDQTGENVCVTTVNADVVAAANNLPSSIVQAEQEPQPTIQRQKGKKKGGGKGEDGIYRYDRIHMINIVKSHPKETWKAYTEAKWNTKEDPFVEQWMRCSFEEQLRRQRKKEQQDRIRVMEERKRIQEKRAKCVSLGTDPVENPVSETNWKDYCARLKSEMETTAARTVKRGPVVPLRDPPTMWTHRVQHYSAWLSAFDQHMKYRCQLGANRWKDSDAQTDSLKSGLAEIVSLTPSSSTSVSADAVTFVPEASVTGTNGRTSSSSDEELKKQRTRIRDAEKHGREKLNKWIDERRGVVDGEETEEDDDVLICEKTAPVDVPGSMEHPFDPMVVLKQMDRKKPTEGNAKNAESTGDLLQRLRQHMHANKLETPSTSTVNMSKTKKGVPDENELESQEEEGEEEYEDYWEGGEEEYEEEENCDDYAVCYDEEEYEEDEDDNEDMLERLSRWADEYRRNVDFQIVLNAYNHAWQCQMRR